MEMDSRLIRLVTPRARNMPVNVVIKGGTFRYWTQAPIRRPNPTPTSREKAMHSRG